MVLLVGLVGVGAAVGRAEGRGAGDGAAAQSDAPMQSSNGPVRVASSVMQRNLVSHPGPVYPAEAQAAHIQGAVVLRANISRAGAVEDVQVVSGPEMLRTAAVDAVRQWTYRPYLLNGEPMEVDTMVVVNFRMDGPAGPRAGPGGVGGGGMSPPVVLHTVDPEFTQEARKAKVGGNVLVHLVVDTDGNPTNVTVMRGIGVGPDGTLDPKIPKKVADGLNAKAVEAVSQYRFKPALKDGQPVPLALNVEVNFQIF